MAGDLIREGSYRDGFEAGFRAIKGTTIAFPALPAQPAVRANSTAFLTGVRKGIERALGKSIDELQR